MTYHLHFLHRNPNFSLHFNVTRTHMYYLIKTCFLILRPIACPFSCTGCSVVTQMFIAPYYSKNGSRTNRARFSTSVALTSSSQIFGLVHINQKSISPIIQFPYNKKRCRQQIIITLESTSPASQHVSTGIVVCLITAIQRRRRLPQRHTAFFSYLISVLLTLSLHSYPPGSHPRRRPPSFVIAVVQKYHFAQYYYCCVVCRSSDSRAISFRVFCLFPHPIFPAASQFHLCLA